MKSLTLCLLTILFFELPFSLTIDLGGDSTDQEHVFVLQKTGGKKAIEQFRQFLSDHLHFDGKINLSARASTAQIDGFTLSFKNDSGVDIRLQFTGFDSFEIRWKLDEQQKPYNCTYQLNQDEIKELPIDQEGGKSKIRATYHHESH